MTLMMKVLKFNKVIFNYLYFSSFQVQDETIPHALISVCLAALITTMKCFSINMQKFIRMEKLIWLMKMPPLMTMKQDSF